MTSRNSARRRASAWIVALVAATGLVGAAACTPEQIQALIDSIVVLPGGNTNTNGNNNANDNAAGNSNANSNTNANDNSDDNGNDNSSENSNDNSNLNG